MGRTMALQAVLLHSSRLPGSIPVSDYCLCKATHVLPMSEGVSSGFSGSLLPPKIILAKWSLGVNVCSWHPVMEHHHIQDVFPTRSSSTMTLSRMKVVSEYELINLTTHIIKSPTYNLQRNSSYFHRESYVTGKQHALS